MSCYIVSDKHISAIIRHACRNSWNAGWHEGRYAYRPGMEDEAYKLLAQANVNSVNARYQEDNQDLGEYQSDAPLLKPIQVIKAIDGLAYQCDNWPEWEGSAAQALLNDIRDRAIGQLPGYEEAAWSIE
jgi:hypothetical protein